MAKVRVVYHPRFTEVYDIDPAAARGRIEAVLEELGNRYTFVEPEPATDEDILLVHTPEHLERVRRHSHVYELALLAAGGAIKASDLAVQGEPAFALIRPPGHHAGPNSCWGFCWFNNVAIAVEKLRQKGHVRKALIIDFDLHYGDGTAKIFSGNSEVRYCHLSGQMRESVLRQLEVCLERNADIELIAVSAGFDNHEADWGGLLKTEDYTAIASMLKAMGLPVFAALEGGYSHRVLGKNVVAFLAGLS
ncbi:histone deacetylase family protein [Syntrophothermus lipocalidus]|uniref:histone deacetylase family protein n=1 Tax=Syntrophothermus lipocalidus TaxID=86170 RepID=UPI001F610AE8|nr:histone deacetylase family protein [Syntrophothermus lipocalidus]HOV43382.1 histone deacetylase family protein [Syntrophothermus lipocalidus]